MERLHACYNMNVRGDQRRRRIQNHRVYVIVAVRLA